MKHIELYESFIGNFRLKYEKLLSEFNRIFSISESLNRGIELVEDNANNIHPRLYKILIDRLSKYIISDYFYSRLSGILNSSGYKDVDLVDIIRSLDLVYNSSISGNRIIYKGSDIVMEYIDGGEEGEILRFSDNLVFKLFSKVKVSNSLIPIRLVKSPSDYFRVILKLVYNRKGKFIGYISEDLIFKHRYLAAIYEISFIIDDIFIYECDKIYHNGEVIFSDIKKYLKFDYATFSTLLYLRMVGYDLSELEEVIDKYGYIEVYNRIIYILDSLLRDRIFCRDLKSDAFGIDGFGNIVISDIGGYYKYIR